MFTPVPLQILDPVSRFPPKADRSGLLADRSTHAGTVESVNPSIRFLRDFPFCAPQRVQLSGPGRSLKSRVLTLDVDCACWYSLVIVHRQTLH